MTKRLLIGLLFITIPFFASAQNRDVSSAIARLQTQIQELLKHIGTLQQQVRELKTELGQQPESAAPIEEVVPEASPPELTRTLSRGSSGDDVRELQEFLSRESTIYPEGLVTGYYGPLTERAVKRWQAKHGIEAAGSVGAKTIAAMRTFTAPKGAAPQATPAIPAVPAQPVSQTGATTVPAVPAQPAQSATTTSAASTSTPASPVCATDYSRCRTKKDCEGAGFFWYTVSCHPNPPPQSSCAASYSYCGNPTECSAQGWYWCRNSCYGTADACLGETYVPPAQPAAIPAAPAVPATPAQPTSQTSTTTVPAVPAIPTQTSTTTAPTPSPSPSSYGSALDLTGVSNVFGKIWNPNGGIVVGAGLNYSTEAGVGWAQQYGGKFVTSYSIVAAFAFVGVQAPYLTQTNPVTAVVTGPFGSVIEVWDLETLKVIATNSTNPGEYVTFTAEPNHRYGGFAWYVDNSEKDIPIHAAYFKDKEFPSAPTYLTATAISPTQVNLSWNPSTDKIGIGGYWIYRNGAPMDASVKTSTTYSDTGLAAATAYSYSVVAYNAAGVNSLKSFAATVTTPSATTTATTTTSADTTAPSVPAHLTATVLSSTQINLSWSASTDNSGLVLGYRIYRNGTSLTDVTAGTAYSDNGSLIVLAPATTYAYTVAAYDTARNFSPQSSAASVTTPLSSVLSSAPPGPGNSSLTVSRLFVGQYDNTKYLVTLNDPDGVGDIEIGKANSDIFWVGSPRSGTTPCPTTMDTGTVTFQPSDFPLKGWVIDCAHTAVKYSVEATQPPLTTVSTAPPAPTNVQAVTSSGSQKHPPEMWYYLTFNYTLQSATQSFAVYRKRPTDASFVKYTYNAQTPVNPSILPLPGSNGSNLYHRDSNQWQWWTTLPAPAPVSAEGEYKFYVTAVDTNNVESPPSETKSFKLYAAPAITNPSDGSTVSAPWTIAVAGDQTAPNPTYGMALYKKITGDTAWSAWPAPSTNFTYTGPALNPSDNPHRLVVWFSSGIYDRSLFGTSIFNVSTTTSSLHLRAANLAAVSQALDTVREALIKLLQGL